MLGLLFDGVNATDLDIVVLSLVLGLFVLC